MNRLELRALEGTHPLGFMAALGLLRLLDHEGIDARLGFPSGHAVLESPLDEPALLDLLGRVVQARAASRELSFAPVLKHAPADWSDELAKVRAAALAKDRESLRAARFFSAYASDLAVAGTGDTKPTAFDMTAGQQQFVGSLQELTAALAAAGAPPVKPKRGGPKGPTLAAELTEALFGPWRYGDDQHPLGWDPWAERLYAYVASAPAKAKGGMSTRAAVWLAAESLPFFPVFAMPSRWRVSLQTTGVLRRDGEAAFVWPVWEPLCGVSTVRSLLASRELASSHEAGARGALAARGVRFVCRSVRADLGTKGYAIFRPPEVLPVGGAV